MSKASIGAARGVVLLLTGSESRPVIKTPIPGPNAQRIIEKDHQFVATTTKTSPIAGKRGKGSVIEDVDGNILLDFTSGIGVTNLGHGHPAVDAAVREQFTELVHFAGTDFYYEVQAALAERLARATPGDANKKVFFTQSGAESVEAAIKVAKWSTERTQFIAFLGAFHGRTHGAGALTASRVIQRGRFFPFMPGVVHVPFPDPYRNIWGIDGYDDPEELSSRAISFIEDQILTRVLPPEELAAAFVEPVQGEGGYVVPPAGFYRQLQKLLGGHGALLVADEVQTGFGRTGRLFGMEHEEVVADVTTMAKGIANGYPLGAVAYKAHLDFGVKGAHSNTYGGNLVTCSAALAVLDVLEGSDVLPQSRARSEELVAGLREMQEGDPGIGDVRGRGLMIAFDMVKDPRKRDHDKPRRDRIIQEAWKRGLILLPCGTSAVRIIPPLVVSAEQVAGGLEVLREAVRATRA
jgi:4-aminobutyrate aminotransferase